MDLWRSNNWKQYAETSSQKARKSIRFRFKNNVNQEVRRACIEFGHWLRREFCFPLRVTIYFKSDPFIKAYDGEDVSATFFEPFSKNREPYIRIATGDYHKMLKEWGKDNALAAILGSIAHELTHYFQWLNNVNLTDSGSEKQASYYRKKILAEYSQTREHP